MRALVDDVLGTAPPPVQARGLRERLGFLKNIGEGLGGVAGDMF